MDSYIIEILGKVSFDPELFRKEFKKSKRWLTAEEWLIVKNWVLTYHSDKVDSSLSTEFHNIKMINSVA